jgi:hypothetical protein
MQSLAGNEDHELVPSAWGTNLEFGGDGSGDLSGPYTVTSNTTIVNPKGYKGTASAGVPTAIAGYTLTNVVAIDATHYSGNTVATPTHNTNYVEWKEFQCEGCNDHKAAQETGMAADATGRVGAVTNGNYSGTVRVKE